MAGTEQYSRRNRRQKVAMQAADFSLSFVCPVCRARPQEPCSSKSGVADPASHAERQQIAREYQGSPAFHEGSPLAAWIEWRAV